MPSVSNYRLRNTSDSQCCDLCCCTQVVLAADFAKVLLSIPAHEKTTGSPLLTSIRHGKVTNVPLPFPTKRFTINVGTTSRSKAIMLARDSANRWLPVDRFSSHKQLNSLRFDSLEDCRPPRTALPDVRGNLLTFSPTLRIFVLSRK
jgi:hypothetical protein